MNAARTRTAPFRFPLGNRHRFQNHLPGCLFIVAPLCCKSLPMLFFRSFVFFRLQRPSVDFRGDRRRAPLGRDAPGARGSGRCDLSNDGTQHCRLQRGRWPHLHQCKPRSPRERFKICRPCYSSLGRIPTDSAEVLLFFDRPGNSMMPEIITPGPPPRGGAIGLGPVRRPE